MNLNEAATIYRLRRIRKRTADLLAATDWAGSKARWTESEKAAAQHMYRMEIEALDEAIFVISDRASRRAARSASRRRRSA